MPKITIIGNSAAGDSCLKELLNKKDNQLTMISAEEGLSYRRDLLVDFISGKIDEKQLFLSHEDFYSSNKVAIYRKNPCVRLDTKKKRVILKDNTKIDYDYVVIACGQAAELPDIPGKSKDGVFVLYSLADAKEIKQRLSISQHTCIAGEMKLCLALAQVLDAKDREAKIISTPKPEGFLSSEKSEWIEGVGISEIIGEGSELKALKLANGKALAATLIIFCGGYKPSAAFLKDTEVALSEGYVITDDNMKTNIEGVFACGSIAGRGGSILKEKAWTGAAQEGLIAAQYINSITERG